jgi:chemotaxis protein MotB
VASSKYNKLQAEQTALQSEQQKLQESANQLQAQNAKLQSQVDSLRLQQEALTAERDSLAQKQAETASKYDQVVNQLSEEVNAGQLQVKQYKNMLTVDVAEHLFFDSGSATIKASGKDVLKKVGDVLQGVPDKVIRVVGHTDSIPLAKSYQAKFPSNWELSVMRATNVVRFLQDQCKIAPERLVASGRGQYEPIASNSTPEGRQQNRRIEIMLIDRSVAESMRAAGPK